MAAFSNALEAAIINMLRGTNITAPTALKLHLYTSDPADNDVGSEVSGGGYSAQDITLSAPVSVAGVGTTTKNSTTIVFGPASSSWGSITHWAIRSLDGSVLFHLHGSFLAAKAVGIGDSYTVPNDTLEVLVR